MKPISILLCLLCFFASNNQCKAQLTAAFTANTTNGCSPIVVNFSDQSIGNPTEWRWDLGNGTLSTLKNPSATYFTPGFYTIKLWIRSGNRTDSVKRTNYINVFNSPVVDFGAGNTNGCSPLAVNFTDNSSLNAGNIVSRQWDFGDGILSSLQNPQHTYIPAGNFNVTLTVMAANGCTSSKRKSSFIVNNIAQAAFNSEPSGICSPNKIVFTNESNGNGILNYTWQFGDGTSSSARSPVHTYSEAGVYPVKLVIRSNFGCRDSVIKNVTVYNRLAPSFTVDNTINCKAPATVQFTNQTIGDNTYTWSFGDSTYSSLASPSHTYVDTGAYHVKLVVKDSTGCTDSLFISNYIKIQKAYVNLLALPDSGCVPFTKNFNADIFSYDSIINYSWNMGNGIILNGPSPVYTFNNAGNYNLSLITTSSHGCKDTTTIANAVKAGNKPTARFSADSTNACASSIIKFTDLSIGNITSWEWDFGDLSTATEKNPTHGYLDTGWMTVQLTVRDRGCADIATYREYIYIKPAMAKFKVVMLCDSPYKRTFNNFSLGATRWLWDFGDGTFSNQFSPAHIFPAMGTFYVTLKVWNDATGCSQSSTKAVKITDATADFFTRDSMVCRGDTVFFNAVSNPEIVSYSWYFGDGIYFNSSRNTASHVYNEPGVYPVRLTVKDSLGCTDIRWKYNYINVMGPVAKFGSTGYDICVKTPVTFIDSSTVAPDNPITKWEWNYEDGIKDTLFSPPFTHAFFSPGTYKPLLKLTDSMGCTDTFRLVRPIIAGKIQSHFVVSDSIACPGFSLKFTCPYSMPGISYRWDFGDGQTSSLQIPRHTYAMEGTYTVKLYVSKLNSCTDSTIRINAVKIKQTKAYFNLSDSFSTCPPLLVGFSSHSVNSIKEYWNFGDSTYTDVVNPSHYYTYPGEYNAVLIAKGYGGCADTIQKKIIIKGPKGTISSDHRFSCKPYNYNFTAHTENAISYVWDFDDGVTQNRTDSIVNHIYSDSGKFIPKIILEDADGCRVPVFSKDTLTNIFVNPLFTFSDSIVCTNQNISFNHSSVSNDSLTGFVWNFGDSTFSMIENSSHQFNSAGIYYPWLKVTTSAGCVNTFHSLLPVKILPSPSFNILATGSGCTPLHLTLNAVSTDAGVIKWRWDMGNADTSVLQNPPVHTYTAAGEYTISLSATNAEGCTKIAQHIIKVHPAAATEINGDSTICRGNNLTLNATGAAKYKWFPSTGFSCDTCVSVTAHPLLSTKYIVTGTTAHGCSSNDTLNVNVHQPFHMQYRQSADICKGDSKILEVTGAGMYQWSPSYALSSIVSSKPSARPDTSTEYVVIGSDLNGCFTDTGKIKVNVYPYPVVKACEDRTITVGSPVSLDATYSPDVTEVYWSPTDNLSRYDLHSILVKPIENTEYTVKVKNSTGCTSSDRVTVFVTCNNNNVFVPTLFSPNNDGVNDVFYPRGTGLLKIRTLRIFNRWGETVFEKKGFNANDPSAGWDGTYKGSQLISDVFVYVMDLVCENSSVLSLKGNISLVK